MTAAPPISLTTPVAAIPGVTAKQAEALRSLGLTNLGRLVAHLPMRHEKHEAEERIESLEPGRIASARGLVAATRVAGVGKKARFQVVLMDDHARLDLVWFNAPYLRHKIMPGVRLRVQGETKKRGPGLQMANPKFEILPESGPEPGLRDEALRPVYPASELCPTTLIEKVMKLAAPLAEPLIEDHLPPAFIAERNMPPLGASYRMQHMPETPEEIHASHRRLAYDELLLLQLGVFIKRAHLRNQLRAPALRWTEAIDAHIRERFPFALTPGQESVVRDLVKDLTRATPANRLIQGDVGSGKTLVALYAMLMAVADGRQAAIMAPTEILAEQHHLSIGRVLEGSRVRFKLLTGATPRPEREATLAALAAGEIDILIGTHALLTESVRFNSLAVAVIDEQHRFGVHQRATLREKASDASTTPHVLVMTATPIPRTLAITLFGDLDVSTISGLPPGRRPITTAVLPALNRPAMYKAIAKRLAAGDQAYIVAPAIDAGQTDEPTLESLDTPDPYARDAVAAPTAGLRTVKTIAKELEEHYLPGKRIGILHGRLARDTREHTMERFRLGQIDVLLATTVIEVGVDVPNATMMVVEQADRFGLAQLHQLRGRIGRGSKDSVCYLVADAETDDAKERLKVMETVTDGFVLAERDLELRGPGQLFGSRQSGVAPLKVADLMQDRQLLAMARRDAAAWVERSPRLDAPEEALLRRRLVKTHGPDIGLADVG